MNWITVIWSMNAGACLTLAAFYGAVWSKQRENRVYLLFSCSAAAVAVIENPYAGQYVEDLSELMTIGEELGELLTQRAIAALGIAGPSAESYGKAAAVGGIVSGAVTGLAADLATGGLTLGVGMLTSIPNSFLFLLSIGWTSVSPLRTTEAARSKVAAPRPIPASLGARAY